MIRYILNKILLSMEKRYDYDVHYMRDILKADQWALLKYFCFQLMSSHHGNLPPEPLFAARIRSILAGDCGPCTQLVINMALEQNVNQDILRAIIECDLKALPEDIAVVVRFTELVLTRNPEADELRTKIIATWGVRGLIAIAYSISSSSVYPSLKYALGYGKICSKLNINDNSLKPVKVVSNSDCVHPTV